MAAPNLANVTSITLKTVMGALTTSLATLLTCTSNKAIEVVSIFIANVDPANACDCTLSLDRSGTTPTFVPAVTVQPKATLVPVTKDDTLFLEEGDLLRGLASAANDLHFVISYREYDDA